MKANAELTNLFTAVFNSKKKATKIEHFSKELGSKYTYNTTTGCNNNIVFGATKIKLTKNNLLNSYTPFTKVFIIRGIGYQADIVEDIQSTPEFSYSRYLSLRVGHSYLIFLQIPNYIGVKVHKKDRKLVVYGPNKEQVSNFSKIIFNLRPPSVYTGRGIRIKKGFHRRKLGKKDIRKGKA